MLKQKKYTFGLPKLEYFGPFCLLNGLKADPAKYKAIQKWPQRTNLEELKSFLGKVNYYSKFVHSFAQITVPLYKLLYKDIK